MEKLARDPNKIDTPLTCVLYGPSGSGKTTISSSFPKPLLHLDVNEHTAEVLRGIDGISTISVEGEESMDSIFDWLKGHPEKYRSVVVDSIGQYQDMLINEANGFGKNHMTMKDWGRVGGIMKTCITKFATLPCNVAFIAHDRVFTIDEGTDAELDGQVITLPEVGPAVMPSVSKVLNAQVGIIGNTFILERQVKHKKTVKGKVKITQERVVEYCLRLGPHAVYRSKVRKPLGVTVPPYIVNPTHEKLLQVIGGTYGSQ